MNPKRQRRKYYINRQIQGKLVRKLVANWALMWAVVFVVPVLIGLVYGLVSTRLAVTTLVVRMIGQMWFPLVMSALFLPIALWDSVHFSHRIAGPMFRLQRELEHLNQGQPVQSVRLRKGDYFQEFAEEFNRLLETRSPEDAAPRPAVPGGLTAPVPGPPVTGSFDAQVT